MRSFRFLFACLLANFTSLSSLPAHAQIVPDQTFGAEESIVTPNEFAGVQIDIIEGGAVRGINLFHSFEEFNVKDGHGVFFFNPDSEIQNILARVTGNDESQILGTLGSFGESTSDLFLINPNGVVFGENSSLRLQGSLFVTTANEVIFENRSTFGIGGRESPSALLSVDPSAFSFNNLLSQGRIINRSTASQNIFSEPTSGLLAPEGEILTLLGRDVSLEGGLIGSFGGRVELASVIETSQVFLNDNRSLSFPSETQRGNVGLTDRSVLFGIPTMEGGDIAIKTDELLLLESRIVLGTFENMETEESQGGNLHLDARNIVVTQSSTIENNVQGQGDSGDLSIKADNLFIGDNSLIVSNVQGQGDSGDLSIKADNLFIGDNSLIASNISPNGVGDGGDISIQVDSLTLTDGGEIQVDNSSTGNTGNILIEARSIFIGGTSFDGFRTSRISSSIGPFGRGEGGNITVSAEQIDLRDGGEIGTVNLGSGNTGNILVLATNGITIDGTGVSGSFSSGISSRSGVEAEGNSGNIAIQASFLSVLNGGQLSSSTAGRGNSGDIDIDIDGNIFVEGLDPSGFGSSISSSIATSGLGRGGDITVFAGDTLQVSNGGSLRAVTQSEGDGGNILIGALNAVNIVNNAIISSDTTSGGNGGDVRVSAQALNILDGGRFETNSSSLFNDRVGQPGKIEIDAEQITISGSGEDDVPSILVVQFSPSTETGEIFLDADSLLVDRSGIIASVAPGGSGGNLSLNLQELLLLRRGGVISVTAGTEEESGNGGNIDINSPFVIAIPSENSDIVADAFQGSGGNIQITASGIFGFEFQTQQNLSDISASSDVGTDGVVELDTLDTGFIENGILELPDDLVNSDTLLSGICGGRSGNTSGGTFTLENSDRLPQSPTQSPPSAFSIGTVRSTAEATQPIAIAEPQTIHQLPDGRLVMSRNCEE